MTRSSSTSSMSPVQPAVWFPAIRAGTGADVFTDRLCNGLVARGLRAEIGWLPHRAEYAPLTCRSLRAPPWANIVHVNTWIHARFAPPYTPLVATMHHVVHDDALERYKTRLQSMYHRFWIKPMEAEVLARAAAITAVSRYTAGKTIAAFGARQIEVIHNGLDLRDYPRRAEARVGKPFRVLFIGSWSTRKGVDLLPPIMKSLGDDFELRFTGTPNPSQRASLPANSVALGRLTDQELRKAYASSDALLLPSRLEGFGQVAMEAMASGLPVVATDGSALPEVVEHGVTGLLCPQDDVLAFAGALRELASDHGLWVGMSAAAIARATREFDISLMLDRYIELYRSIL